MFCQKLLHCKLPEFGTVFQKFVVQLLRVLLCHEFAEIKVFQGRYARGALVAHTRDTFNPAFVEEVAFFAPPLSLAPSSDLGPFFFCVLSFFFSFRHFRIMQGHLLYSEN